MTIRLIHKIHKWLNGLGYFVSHETVISNVSATEQKSEITCINGEQRKVYRLHGKLHHPCEPARTVCYPDGSKIEEHYLYGDRHSDAGPAIIKTEADGSVWREYWLNDKRHSETGPAVIVDRADGTQRLEYWHNMVQHCDIGPAIIENNVRGLPVHEEFWQYGRLVYVEQNVVKDNTISLSEIAFDPATYTRIRLIAFADGRTEEVHHRKGKLHREAAPARIITSANGTHYEEYWIDGLPLKLNLNELPSLRRTSAVR